MLPMRSSSNTTRKQTAVRFEPRVLARAKEAAKLSNTSLNDYINTVVEKATEDIRTMEELEEERRRTEAFLKTCAGSWEGPETVEEIMRAIKDGNTTKDIVEL